MYTPKVVTPELHSQHRSEFEHAFHHGNETIVRLWSIGGQLEEVRNILDVAATDGEGPTEILTLYRTTQRDSLIAYVTTQAEALTGGNLQPGSSLRQNPTLYAALCDQLALLPVLFTFDDDDTAYAHRSALIGSDGIYGIIGTALDDQLRAPAYSYVAQQERMGEINQLTALALLNRPQDPNEAALPTLPFEDEVKKQDIVFYCLDKEGCLRVLTRQVKSNERNADRGQTATLIGGIALGNMSGNCYWGRSGDYQTARAIVDELNGDANDRQLDILGKIAADLRQAVIDERPFTEQHLPRAA